MEVSVVVQLWPLDAAGNGIDNPSEETMSEIVGILHTVQAIAATAQQRSKKEDDEGRKRCQ